MAKRRPEDGIKVSVGEGSPVNTLLQPLPLKPRIKRLVTAAVLFLVFWPVLAWLGAEMLIKESKLDRADAIAVYSGAAAYVERVRRAAELYKQGVAPTVLLSNADGVAGWSKRDRRNPSFLELAMQELIKDGVPADRIEIVPGLVSNTYNETARFRDYSAERGFRTLLLVTSPYHSRRALWTARRSFSGTGITVGLETMKPGLQSPHSTHWWLSSAGWDMVFLEWVKLVYYRIAY